MRAANFVIIIFSIFSIAIASELKKAATGPGDPTSQGRDIIAKIYNKLTPSQSKVIRKPISLPPGELYNVGGYRLHIYCTGTSNPGAPTIILESGVGNSSTDWVLIQEEVSRRARVCSYDRAGYGWSDEWPALKTIKSVHEVPPRSIDQNAEALDHLLTQAGISGAIILVGASYGGPLSLAFEAKYPKKVSGLVLVDPHDDGIPLSDDPYNEAISDSLQELEMAKSAKGKAEWETKLKEITQHLTRYSGEKVQARILVSDLSTLVNSMDPLRWLRSMFSEWRSLHSSCAKVKANPSSTLADKPLTILSSDPTHQKTEGRLFLHMKIARRSSKGRLLIAKGAGHDIANDRPDLVVKTIQQMLDMNAGIPTEKLNEETLPQINQPARFFVDSDLANFIRFHTQTEGPYPNLVEFCRQLRLGFNDHGDFGYIDHRKTGAGGYFVVCTHIIKR